MKRLTMILFVVLTLGGCIFLDYPKELDVFIKNTDKAYWYIDAERGSKVSISLMQSTKKHTLFNPFFLY